MTLTVGILLGLFVGWAVFRLGYHAGLRHAERRYWWRR